MKCPYADGVLDHLCVNAPLQPITDSFFRLCTVSDIVISILLRTVRRPR